MDIPRGLVALALLAVTASHVAAGSDDPPTRLPLTVDQIPAHEENWYALSVDGTRVGWARMVVERVPVSGSPGSTLVRCSQRNHIEIRHDGEGPSIEETESLEFDGRPPYPFLGGSVVRGSAGARRTLLMTRSSTGVTVSVKESDGSVQARTVPVEFTLADKLTPRLWLTLPRKKGEVLTYRSLDTSEVVVATSHMTILDVGSLETAAGTARWVDARNERISDGKTSVLRFDTANDRLFQFTQGAIEGISSSEAAARSSGLGDTLMDALMVATVDSPIGAPQHLSGLVLDTRWNGAQIPSGPRQAVARDPATGVLVVTLGEEAGPPAPATQAEISEALAATERYGRGLPEVASLAVKGIGDAKTPRQKVENLVHFTSRYVKVGLSGDGSRIETILRTRRGDCKEVAILFTALARGAGIPTREVDGLVYMGDEALGFAGHRWNEVVLDGRWVPVDPTQDEILADVGHVALIRGIPPDFCEFLDEGDFSFHLRERRPAK